MYNWILFDLDGTLTDPGIGITNSVWTALRHFNIEVTDRTELYKFIGPPLIESFEEYYGMSYEQSVEAVKVFRAYFESRGMYENVKYDGIEEMLSKLRAKGKKLIVATSKPEEFAKRILEHFGLLPYFDYVCGASFDETRTKKEEVLQYTIEKAGITNLRECVMVGDRKHDIEGGHAVSMDTVGVLYGYGSREELQEAGAEYIAEDVRELTALLCGEEEITDSALFSVDVKPTRKELSEFQNLAMNRKGTAGMLIPLILFLALGAVVVFLSTDVFSIAYAAATVVIIVMTLFRPEIVAARMVKNGLSGGQYRADFTHEQMLSETAVSKTEVKYSAFTEAYESENLYALFTTKSIANVAPKNSFTKGNASEFPAFFTEKTGLPVKKLKPLPSFKLRLLLCIASALFLAGLAVGAFMLKNAPKKFTAGEEYEITLTRAFKDNTVKDETEAEGSYLYEFESDDVTVYVSPYRGWGKIHDMETFVDICFDKEVLEEYCTVEEDGIRGDNYILRGIDHAEDGDVYFYDVVHQSGENMYITEFLCRQKDRKEYEKKFEEWAKSIRFVH